MTVQIDLIQVTVADELFQSSSENKEKIDNLGIIEQRENAQKLGNGHCKNWYWCCEFTTRHKERIKS